MDRAQTEESGEIGRGFSESVAVAWEEALFTPELPDTRRVALRMPIVSATAAHSNRSLP